MTPGRRLGAPLTAAAARGVAAVRTRGWAPSSRLFVVGDRGGWSIDDDAVHVAAIARRLGYDVAPTAWARYTRGQAVWLPSHFTALRPLWLESSHRLGLAYFHGRPGTPGHPEFDATHDALRRHASRIDRVQVTHAEMHDLVVDAGVDPARVFTIPIGIDIERFPLRSPELRRQARAAFGLAEWAFVVGSFQKDGTGWGAGLEPKPVKGPDTLIETLRRLRDHVPELVVLLTGPARGYVMAGLAAHGIPYVHRHIGEREGLAPAYHALDAYLVASRQEGGPKSALEALATGVPLVSTRVGQVPELAEDGRDALLADVEDADGLAARLARVHDDGALRDALVSRGRALAESNAYERLDGRWAELLTDFVPESGRARR